MLLIFSTMELMVARSDITTGIPQSLAWAAVCAPMHTPVMRSKGKSSPTVDTKPLTVEALVKVTRAPYSASSRSRSSSERGLSYTVR